MAVVDSRPHVSTSLSSWGAEGIMAIWQGAPICMQLFRRGASLVAEQLGRWRKSR